MAVEACCEPLSDFPVNREKYREFLVLAAYFGMNPILSFL